MNYRVLIIVNPVSGKRNIEKYIPQIKENFEKSNFQTEIKYTSIENDAGSIIKNCKEKFDIIVICGGDGTLNQAVQGINYANINVPVGFIPGGTTNDFANSLQSYADQSQYAEFKITIKGIVKMGDEENYAEYTENSVEVILGNTYLNEDTGKWEVYILKDWELIDLTTINETDGLYGLNFTVEGTDKSGGFDNWPTYFAMDNISYTAVPEPATFAMIFGTLAVALAAYKRRSNN